MISANTRPQALTRQIRRLDHTIAILRTQSQRWSNFRLLSFFAGLALTGLLLFYASWLWTAVAAVSWLLVFAVVVVVHQRIDAALTRYQIWRSLKQTHLSRMNLDWEHIPKSIFSRPPSDHPFARDLDLTGEFSLHRLLDTAVSRDGSQRLRTWLFTEKSDAARIAQRQEKVKMLARRPLFRDKLTLHGMLTATGLGGGWQGDRLLKWLQTELPTGNLRPALIASLILAPITWVLLLLQSTHQLPPWWIGSLTLYIFLQFSKSPVIAATFERTLTLQNGFKSLTAVFDFLERSKLIEHSTLQSLCEPFAHPTNRPSVALQPVNRLVIGMGVVQNPMIGILINLVVPWNLFFADQLNRYKRQIADQLPVWLDAWVELETLSSLATFAYLNPNYTFPEIQPPTAQPVFNAAALGHPLIPTETRVNNNFTVNRLGEVFIITGSNMAGKSSFLRTVGVNMVLAYAGGPIAARQCTLVPLRLFTALTVTDSVTDGISYFYAEVKRLKRLLQALQSDDPLPLCHLIDEIFRGTNNRERYLGSKAYISTLVGKRGFGLVATHDLELVKLAEAIPQISNFHFKETVADGKMIFDFHLRPGPCPTTNALKIMALEGLPVSEVDMTGE